MGETDTCQQFPSMQDYLSGLIDIDKLSDTEICKLFGLEEKVLRDTFQPIVENILSIFYYIKTGKLLQEKDDYKNLNVIFGDENLENIWGPSELSIQAMLRMLVLIFDKLNSNVFLFFLNSIQKIPYVFNNSQDCNVNFNPKTNCFETFLFKNDPK